MPTASPIFAIDWQIWSNDWVQDISVNGNPAWTSPLPTAGHPLNTWNSQPFKWCSGWNSGNNRIVVHTISNPSTLGGIDNLAGIAVQSWATIPSTISGNTLVCQGSINNYTTTPIVTGTPTIAMNYAWTLPLGWSNPSNTNTISTTASANSGLITVYVQSWNGPNNPPHCWSSTQYSVTVMPTPTVNITASSLSVCPGGSTTLTASGASTYSWVLPGNITTNTVVVSSGTYSVIGTGTNGCTTTTVITISTLPPPTIFISPAPSFVCANISNTLTASGGTSYAWVNGPATNPWIVNLTPPQTVTVIGTGANSCTNIATLAFLAGSIIPVSAVDATLCTDVSPCISISASSTFTSWPPTYTWSGPSITGPLTAQSTTVCPIANAIYTVTANSPVLCPNSTTIAVTVQTCCPPPDPAITFVMPNNPQCNLTFTNLAQYVYSVTPSGGQIPMTGTFSGTGVTPLGGGQYIFNQSQTLTYGNYVIAFTFTTAPWGCSYTLYQTVTVLPPLTLYALPASRCPYSPNPVTIFGAMLPNQPAPFFPWAYPISYTWSPGNMTGSGATSTAAVSPTVNTVYTITAISAGCVGTTTLLVSMLDCCPQTASVPVLGLTTLTATVGNGPVLTGPIVINQDVTITGFGNYRMFPGDFIIAPGVKITVEPNVTLLLADAHFYACKHMWQGFVVKNGGAISAGAAPNGSCTLIEDAMIAIDVDSINLGHANPILNLDGVTFNKNCVGMSIHNSTLSTIPIAMRSCVFTSRDLPTGNMLWPSSSTNPGGLRYAPAASILNSLSPPFLLSNYPIDLPAVVLTGLPWGIKIYDIGNISGAAPSPGVDFTSSAPIVASEFNLFDDLQVGFALYDASMTTYNNTFQNMAFACISHSVSTTMNGRLSLSSPQPGTGNRFYTNFWNASTTYWNGYWNPRGIMAYNLMEFDIEQAIFRGFTIPTGGSGPAIELGTNRFNNYNIRKNFFSNVPNGVNLSINPGPYDVTGVTSGIYAGSMDISDNFFSPVVSSTTQQTPNESFGTAISIGGPNVAPWLIPGITATTIAVSQPNFIQNNIFDRVMNGVGISEMYRYPIGVINNTITLAPNGTGITMFGTMRYKSIRNNIVTSSPLSSAGANILCMANASLAITCNTVIGGNIGFDFLGTNACEWAGNTMDNNAIGLHLGSYTSQQLVTYPGWIGQQGNPTQSSGNKWIGTWGTNGSFSTMLDFPAFSWNNKLYVTALPVNNGGQNPYCVNCPFPSMFTVIGPYNCPSTTLMERFSNETGVNEQNKGEQENINIFPNPSSGKVTVFSEEENESLHVTVTDVTGKIVYEENIKSKSSIDISSLKASIYLIQIRNKNNQIVRKKLVKAD